MVSRQVIWVLVGVQPIWAFAGSATVAAGRALPRSLPAKSPVQMKTSG